MKLRQEDWAELFDDEDHGGLLVPILALAHEHDPDPTLRPYKEPMDAQRREQLVLVSLRACPASTATFFPGAVCLHERSVAQERTGARGRRWVGMILARAGQGRSSRSAAGR